MNAKTLKSNENGYVEMFTNSDGLLTFEIHDTCSELARMNHNDYCCEIWHYNAKTGKYDFDNDGYSDSGRTAKNLTAEKFFKKFVEPSFDESFSEQDVIEMYI